MLTQGTHHGLCQEERSHASRKERYQIRHADSKKKFLILDLDETLIHSVDEKQPAQVVLTDIEEPIRMNVRPYCFEFLQKMSEHY